MYVSDGSNEVEVEFEVASKSEHVTLKHALIRCQTGMIGQQTFSRPWYKLLHSKFVTKIYVVGACSNTGYV